MRSSFKRNWITAFLIPAIGLSALSVAYAESKPASNPATTTAAQQGQESVDVRGSKLIGKDVVNAQGKDLGEIRELIVDVANQRVPYAILSFGGALGVGSKLFAYPINSFKPSTDQDKLVLNVSKDALKRAPGFERNNWPDWNDNRYRGEVDRYFKAPAAGASPAAEQFVRASYLIGKNADDRTGRHAGELEDLVVNLGTGQVRYAVLDFDQAWTPNDKMLPLPLSAFLLPAQRGRDLVLNIESSKLDMARAFEDDKWPDLNNVNYRRSLDTYLASFGTSKDLQAQQPAGRNTSSGSSGTGSASDSNPSQSGQSK
jgi:sporulation protein YlmC with PRC-barrel domain